MKTNAIWIGLLLIIFLSTIACEKNVVPKPRGYFRIEMPEKNYSSYNSDCPFELQVPAYSRIEIIRESTNDSCWFNIAYPRFNAKLHLTYLPIEQNLDTYLEDAYTFAFKHEMKANAIKRTEFYSEEQKVSALIYDLKGNVATSLQFYATDSLNHFLRGALYFHNSPNSDSIAPVLDFLREDLIYLIENIEWEDE